MHTFPFYRIDAVMLIIIILLFFPIHLSVHSLLSKICTIHLNFHQTIVTKYPHSSIIVWIVWSFHRLDYNSLYYFYNFVSCSPCIWCNTVITGLRQSTDFILHHKLGYLSICPYHCSWHTSTSPTIINYGGQWIIYIFQRKSRYTHIRVESIKGSLALHW